VYENSETYARKKNIVGVKFLESMICCHEITIVKN
jgi:hypothetical protein